ncbi:hypothetical protein RI367_007162 [Sorochytrium milnesiophthora]
MKLLTLLIVLAYLSLSAEALAVNITVDINSIKNLLPTVNLTALGGQARSFANKAGTQLSSISSYTVDTVSNKLNVKLSTGATVTVSLPKPPTMSRKVTTTSNTTANAMTYQFAAGEPDIKFVERFTVRTNPVPSFGGSFWLNSTASVDWFHFRTGLHKLVEFSNSMAVESSTNVVLLANQNWTAWNTVQKLDDNGNATIYNMTSTATPSTGFTITVEAIMTANTSAVVYGTPLAPRMVKYNIRIVNFPYTMAGSGLALVKTLVTRTADATLSADANGALLVGSGNGRLSWAPTVSLGGSATANISLSTIANVSMSGMYSFPAESVQVDETAQVLLFKIGAVQPNYIFWDPNVEMNEQSMQADSAAIDAANSQSSFANSVATPMSAFLLAAGAMAMSSL